MSQRGLVQYSEDLQWRMVWQSELLGYSQQAIAQNLGVDQSTVSRAIQLFRTTGSVGKKPYPEMVTAPCQLLIYRLFLQHPGIHIYEVQRELLGLLLVDVNISTIYHFLHETGFSRQKI